MPKGVEELAKDRKEPDLPKKLAEMFDKKEPTFSAVKMEDRDLVQLLATHGIKYKAIPEKTLNWLISWVLPMVLLVGIWIYFFRKIGGGAGGLMTVGKSKAKVYVQDETKVTFQDVAGVDEAIEELKEIIEYLRNPAKFQTLGAKIPKGVLLVGPPGTGKTLLARAVAGEARVPLCSSPAPTLWRCSSGWGPPGCGTCSPPPRRKPPASSLSTNWTPSARPGA